MKRKALRKRLFGGLMTFCLCLTSAVGFDTGEVRAAGADAAPEVAAASGVTWNGREPVRVYVKAAQGTAVDSADLSVTAGGGKYELKDGYLKLKDGEKAAEGDQITIGTTASYYTEDQLLWSDGLETEGSLIPSEVNKYCLVHSDKLAHTGLKAGTTAAQNVKDGMWSPNINSAGRLVFWYYDPCTAEERDKAALKASDPSFDQIKFGMVINNYPDLLFGIGIPAATDKGPNGSALTMDTRVDYVDSYTVRYGGNWNQSNIARTAGWHKMEVDVAADGSRLFIDGAEVCLKGQKDPLVISSVKSINKAAVATNWGDKTGVKSFIQDKHFIDDMYILKPDAGAAKTASISTTITVELADAEKDEAAVEAAKTAIESMTFAAVSQDDVGNEAAAQAWIEDKVQEKLSEIAANQITLMSETEGTEESEAVRKENAKESDKETMNAEASGMETGSTEGSNTDTKSTEKSDTDTKSTEIESTEAFHTETKSTGAEKIEGNEAEHTGTDDIGTSGSGIEHTEPGTAGTETTEAAGAQGTGTESAGSGITETESADAAAPAAAAAPSGTESTQAAPSGTENTNTVPTSEGTEAQSTENMPAAENDGAQSTETLPESGNAKAADAEAKPAETVPAAESTEVTDTKTVPEAENTKNQTPENKNETIGMLSEEGTAKAASSKTATVGGIAAEVNKTAYQAPVSGSLANPDGVNGSYKFTVSLSKNEAAAVTAEAELVITANAYAGKEAKLVFGTDDTGALVKGGSGRVYIENMEDYAIAGVNYTTNNENVTVDADGTMNIKPGYTPIDGETVLVTAEVTYYNPSDVVFADSFEGAKTFTDAASGVYTHTGTGSMFGRKAATAVGSTSGYPTKKLDPVTDVTVTAWYYDANGGADQTKFGFAINGQKTALGIFYDGTIAPYVNNMTKTHYGARVEGCTYNNYAWGTTDAARSAGWHKFEWVIDSEKGLTEKIDGKVISTNKLVGQAETDHNLFQVENYAQVKTLKELNIMEGWNNNATNMSEIGDRHFIDGVSVVKNGAATASKTLTSVSVPLKDVTYTVTPDQFEVDSVYPKAQRLAVAPYMENDTDITKVLCDGVEVSDKLWKGENAVAPDNALNYPEDMKGYRLNLDAEMFKGMAEGEHTLTLVTKAGAQLPVVFTAKAGSHVPTDYYLSNGGNDDADGHTPDTAWKTFEKLQTVTFGPGDHIYLDAESVWSGVQFRPEGSGAPGSPIVMTKYNDGGDSSKRPILNGDGTLADLNAHSYLAFDPWRRFYPSGTIELFNVEQWEVRGIEVTNYTKKMQKGATGRNGIAVIFDYFETQGITALPSSDAAMEQAFYRAGKLCHVVIEDCYIHDVIGYHPDNGAQGRGGKMSGGINAYGPYDDLQINNNIVMYCDVEGIRNDVLAWMGDTRTQFPAYMEDVSVSNNYIAGVPGDGVVISSANKPLLENNYLTDAGYSYYATSRKNNVASGVTWSAGNLASCRAVADETGAQVKDMGNRQSPTTMGEANYAGLWFIGTRDAVAQYNESVNNVWNCSDGEAFDADMYCWGTVFQYNYTYRNNGGMCLFMATMDDGTLVRYNVSVEDGQNIGSGTQKNIGVFHYAGVPEAIYNNLFILGDNVSTIFDAGGKTAYFYNNIVVAPNGLRQADGNTPGFRIANDKKLGGEMKNNLFYPAAITDSLVEGSTIVQEDNIILSSEEELNSVFEDLDGFMAAQPVKALLGRSDFTGTKVDGLENEKGAGVAMSAEAGRGVKTPTGGFDLEQFAGIKLAENSPAIGKGAAIGREYDYRAQNDAALPLTKDFFNNDISEMTTVDIGPFQYSSVHECKFDQKNTDSRYLKSEASCTEPAVYYYSCKCGEAGTETFTSGEALGHDLVQHEGKEATCTEMGWKAYVTCKRGDYTTCEELPVIAHSWDEGKVTVSPTTEKEGERTYTCTVCQTIRTETIEKLPPEPGTPDNNGGTGDGTTDNGGGTENGGNTNGGDNNGGNGGNNNGGNTDGGNGGGNNGGNTVGTTGGNKNAGNNTAGTGGRSKAAGKTDNTSAQSNDGRLSTAAVTDLVEKVEAAKESTTVRVDMKKETVVPKEVLEAAAGKNVDLVLDMKDYQWIINGAEITADKLESRNMEVKMDTDVIPEDLIEEQAGGSPARQFSLTHDGEFGFRAVLRIKAGAAYSGLFGNLYYYNKQQKLEFAGSDLVKDDGFVELEFTHASDYVIVFSETDGALEIADAEENAKETDELSDTDKTREKESTEAPAENTGLQEEKTNSGSGMWVIWLVIILLLAGAAAGVIFVKNKQQKK